MSVNSYTYGTVAGTHRRIGWIVGSRQMFNGQTQPSRTQVEQALDQTASAIHAKLAAAGYPVSTKAVVEANAARVATWLAMLNEVGCCADLLMGFASAGDPDSGQDHPAKYWAAQFKELVKLIDGPFLAKLGLSRDEALSASLRSGSYKDTDGNIKEPLFSRGMTDYPSSRSLTASTED